MLKATQSGNVLFLILIAVALFAALSYVVSQSGRSGASNSDREKISLELNRIHSFEVSLKTALSRMLNDGTSLSQINFDHDGFTVDYNNTSCTTDKCKVFHPQGGGALWDKPPFVISEGDYIISGYSQVKGVGTDAPSNSDSSELIIIVPGITQSTCHTINQLLGVRPQDPIPTDTTGCLMDTGGTNFYYKGTFVAGNIIEDTGTPSALQNKFEMCVRCTGSPDTYSYYGVILSR